MWLLASRNNLSKINDSEGERVNQSGYHTNVGDNDTEREEVVLVNDTTDRYDTNKPISFEQRVENLKRVAERMNVDINLSNLYL